MVVEASRTSRIASGFARIARTFCCALAALLALATSARAQTYHVDREHPAASDSNPGTEQLPYRTILAAVTARKGPGITVLVHPGVYREQISVPASGAVGNPYVIRASGPGVVLDGSDDLSDSDLWEDYNGPVYVAASVNWSPKQVFVNGVRLNPSTSAPGQLPEDSFVYVSGQGLYVNLDGEEPGDHEVWVTRRNLGFTMANRSFVTVDGFEITRTNDRGINMHTCADLLVTNNRVTFTASYGIQAVNSLRVVIERNVVTDTQMHGIGLTGATTASTVRDNESARNVHPTIVQGNGIYVYGAPGNTIHGNNVHHNQDTGVYFSTGSNDCVSFNNRSWSNGDHGYDHTQALNAVHVNDLAWGNYRDGFSFESNSPGGQLHNSISVENGITTNRFDLWVDDPSLAGFVSDYNIFWNSTPNFLIRTAFSSHPNLASHQASGLDTHSIQANPLFLDPANGDFTPGEGSPAIDAAHAGIPHWTATDALGRPPLDDPRVENTGTGPVAYADIGAIEHVPSDFAPQVASPTLVQAVAGEVVSFTVTVNDPDGDPIATLAMVTAGLPPGHGATFVPDSGNTSGTFTWDVGTAPAGNYRVDFSAANWLGGTSTTHIRIRRAEENLGPERTDEPPPPAESDAGLGGPADLSAPHPNPSRRPIEFALTLVQESTVEWGVYDLQGRELWSETRRERAGEVRLAWSGRDAGGGLVSPGIYFARVHVDGRRFVRRIARYQ